jgi:DNA-nicking Smr family endonuclease
MKKGPKNPLSEEDQTLWEKVVKTVRPRPKTAKKPLIAESATTKVPKPAKAAKPATPQNATKTLQRSTSLPQTPAAKTTDDGTARDLKKKKWQIDKKIDLHGMTQHAAQEALTRFILSARKQDKRTLLVITGKGSRSTGGGVLRRMLPLWLEMAPLREAVLALTPARPEDGGDGAYYVRLRKIKS